MVQSIVYAINIRFATLTITEHLCDDVYNVKTSCLKAGKVVDHGTGHHVCCECSKVTRSSGLRECDTCDREYIDKTKFQDDKYETNCPECVNTYEL
jgi:hypothetical protein